MHIEQLEYEVWRLRGEMNRLRAPGSQMDPHIYHDRLNQLEAELSYMNREVLRMKGESACAHPLPTDSMDPAQELPPAFAPESFPKRSPSQGARLLPPFPPGRQAAAKMPRQKIDLEKAFGTGFMGIVASVLIFVSIIIFGSLIIPFLSKEMMAVLMFAVSFALSGAGITLLRKNRLNKFNLSLCACGSTAVCVSLFVTRILFGFIDNVTFLALMAVWMAAMAFLCRQYHYIFRLIGEIGMLMAGILGIAELSLSANLVFYAVLLIVCGGAFAMYHFVNPRENYAKNGLSHIIHTIALSSLSAPLYTADLDASGQLFSYALFIGFLALLFSLSWKEDVENGMLFHILTTLQMIIAGASFSEAGSRAFSLFFLASAVFLVCWFSRKPCKTYMFGEMCASGLYLFGAAATVLSFEIVLFLSVVCVLPLSLYGFLKNRKVFLYAALFGELLCAALTASDFLLWIDWSVGRFLLISVVPLAAFLCAARKQGGLFRSAGYFISMLCFASGVFALCGNLCVFPLSEALPFLILAIAHIAIIQGKVLQDSSKSFEVSYSAVTFLLMCLGCKILNSRPEPGLSGILTFFVVLVLFALFSVNSARLLKKSEFFGYYVAAKYTLLMLLTLGRICSIGIVFSVSLLLFALACIVGGFRFRHKSFRIYGLILSMVSVFKLILFDIEGKSRTSNAFGFLICGIICFGISFVYSKIEHRWRENENSAGEEAQDGETGGDAP